jgi:four helix bundle protein
MTQQEMKDRTKLFCIRVIKLSKTIIKKSEIGKIIGRQVMRSSTSVAANYRALTRSKSKADFINKLRIVKKNWTKLYFGLS